MNSRYWRSNSHGTQRNMNAEFSRSTAVVNGPIAGETVDDRDQRVRIFLFELTRDRARRKIVTLADVGGDDQDLPRASLCFVRLARHR